MATFEEDQIKIEQIRANLLKGGSKTESDKKNREYFDNKVTPVRAKLNGTDKANKASENSEVQAYFEGEVTAEREKLIGKH